MARTVQSVKPLSCNLNALKALTVNPQDAEPCSKAIFFQTPVVIC